jgi:hypothetical protein
MALGDEQIDRLDGVIKNRIDQLESVFDSKINRLVDLIGRLQITNTTAFDIGEEPKKAAPANE